MSADFRLEKCILMEDVFDGCLEEFGLKEIAVHDDMDMTARCLFDGNDSVWLHGEEFVDTIKCYHSNDPSQILKAICQKYNTKVFSEDEPGFLGFKDDEDMSNFFKQLIKEDRDRLYQNVMSFLHCKPHPFVRDIIAESEALIAHELAVENPCYLDPGSKEVFLDAIKEIYDRERGFV